MSLTGSPGNSAISSGAAIPWGNKKGCQPFDDSLQSHLKFEILNFKL
jgi:hypothetical protein